MTLRLKPRVIRHANRKHAKQAGRTLPTDPSGKEIDALQDMGVGEEVWMHFAPSKDELARLGPEPGKRLETDLTRSDATDSWVSIGN
jgi:platelet-activating factor acetylhydrolase